MHARWAYNPKKFKQGNNRQIMGKLNHSRNTLGFLHFLFGLGVLQLFCSSLAIAAFTAEVPRQSYEEGEFILLTLTTDRRNQGSPDLSPLQRNFDIINQTQASQNDF